MIPPLLRPSLPFLFIFSSGSLTLHHWQQLAQPHLATILDPHPGVVTKGFRPLAQEAAYRLNDMEEDEEDEARREREAGVLEKGAAERGKEEDEEEEVGIVFNVRCSSTPDQKKDGKLSEAPLPVAPLSASRPLSATAAAVPEAGGSSSHPAPNVSMATVQSSTSISGKQISLFSNFLFHVFLGGGGALDFLLENMVY